MTEDEKADEQKEKSPTPNISRNFAGAELVSFTLATRVLRFPYILWTASDSDITFTILVECPYTTCYQYG